MRLQRAFHLGLMPVLQIECAGEPPAAAVLPPGPAVELPVAAEVPPASASGAAPQFPFSLIAYRQGQLVLGRFGEQLIVAGAAAFARVEPDGTLSLLPGSIAGELPLDGLREIDMRWRTEAFGGRWPAQAWLVTRRLRWTAKVPHAFRWDGVRWRQVGPPCDGVLCWQYIDFVTWRKGHVLGLRQYQPDPQLLDRRYEAGLDSPEEPADGVRRRSLPDPWRAMMRVRPGFVRLGPTQRGGTPQIAAGLRPIAAAAAPGGSLYLLAGRGADSVIQTWRPDGEAHGVVDVLPGRPDATVLRAVDGQVLVAGARREQSRGYLARFDGATWSEESAPEGRRVCDVTLTANGVLWAVTHRDGDDCEAGRTALWRQEHEDLGWSRVEVPPLVFPGDTTWEYDDAGTPHEESVAGEQPVAVQPRQVVARGEEVWIVAAAELDEDRAAVSAVLRTGPPVAAPLHLPSDRRQYTLLLDVPPFVRPDTDGTCPEGEAVFVRLHDLAPGTADDAPIPEVEALVRDRPELVRLLPGIYEFERDGRRFVGLLIADAVPPDGDALLKTLDRLVPGVRHKFECRLPPVRRALFERPPAG